MFFLVQFKRSRQVLLSMETFVDHAKALENLCNVERINNDSDIEVVLLSSDSEEMLRRTHSRYFSATGQYDLVSAL